MKTATTKSGKILTIRPLQKGDLNALYQYAKTMEKEDTFITLNPKEPLSLKEEDSFLKSTISQIKEKKKVYKCICDKITGKGVQHKLVGLYFRRKIAHKFRLSHLDGIFVPYGILHRQIQYSG